MCIQDAKWLRTRLTDFRAPNECILFNSNWKSISSISLLPFIDDNDNYYGMGIHEYKEELQSIGVAVSLHSGAKFVPSSLYLPQDPSSITTAAVYSLLECIRIFQKEQNEPLTATLSKTVAREWIKTHAGYISPDKCLLFGSDWDSTLWREDGPFIDETFYGAGISCYAKELNALGVVVEKRNGCSLLASYLDTHTNFMSIKRIYTYLNEMNWKSVSKHDAKIWIPNGSDDGKWVNSEECILHDKDGLFGQQLNVLDKHYEKKLLNFFCNALEVKIYASLDDYCRLWKEWEDSGHFLSPDECIAFWVFVAKHWSSITQKVISEKLSKLPVSCCSDNVLLLSKNDVFIADDLLLKVFFEATICLKIEPSAIDTVGPKQQLNPKENFIGRGFFKLLLGFLAFLQIEAEKRHEALKVFLETTFLETPTPITVDYSLPLSSGEIINVSARKLIRWERDKSEFFMHKMDRSGGHKNLLEYATYFADIVSEGMLWDKEDHIPQLAELIKLGFMVLLAS
ncbi:DNA binding [Abeliophyllum distichum]|uniref:DNA binding n=1 Tax=Abeliophyllum distichum TaxID=126358 RepID=A0ABD1VSS1_9LAMI